jgi:hypothetical protein
LAPQNAIFALPKNPTRRNPVFSVHFTDTLPALTSWSPDFNAPIASVYPVATGKTAIRSTIAPTSRFGQMALGQEQPVVPRVLDQSASRLDQSLLQARQRPAADPVRQHQPPPETPPVVSEHAKPRHLHRLLAFFDPLLRRARLL